MTANLSAGASSSSPLKRWARRRLLRLKRWLPHSLFGRSLLIIVLPIALMQAAVTYAFVDAHWRTVSAQLAEALAGDVAWDVALFERDPTPANLAAIAGRAERTQSLSIVLQDNRTLPTSRRDSLIPTFDEPLRRALEERLENPVWLDTTRYPAYVDIRVQSTGGVLRIIAPRDRAFAAHGHVFIAWLTGATLILTAVAILFIKNQVRAIERLADAADAFGRGVDVPRFKPQGAREVRQAAAAFIAMQERIQRHIDQRTTLLASVSHDLRTPLTRLKLELALAKPNRQVSAMKRDVDEMEHMVDEYLAFARGQGGEAVEVVGLRRLIEEVSEGAERAGASVQVAADPALSAPVRPNALKRALSNLVMNAAVHGERVQVAARVGPGGGVEIFVDDDGPGIPPDSYEEAFKPFSRLDESRNQNLKGVGLGLAIARDVARGHGGDVTLGKSPLGGLRAVVRLPG
jgi:two-component system, OmpR family, osmolarity sensor histidine kinase EnvZ